jgi:hypothetical protein
MFELKKSPQRQPSDFSPRSSFDGAFDQFQSSPLTRVTMATGTYPMGSAHPYPYPLGLNFTRRVTRECTRVGK